MKDQLYKFSTPFGQIISLFAHNRVAKAFRILKKIWKTFLSRQTFVIFFRFCNLLILSYLFSGLERIRTPRLLSANEALYQMSYEPFLFLLFFCLKFWNQRQKKVSQYISYFWFRSQYLILSSCKIQGFCSVVEIKSPIFKPLFVQRISEIKLLEITRLLSFSIIG